MNPAPEIQSEQEFSQRFAHVIRGVIDFAGMIPGFQLLTQDDKFTLLKAGLFDALFVRLICMFDTSINSIICLNGQLMRRDSIQNGANARFLVDSTFNFAERMNSMQLTDAEIGLFCAIVLITPDRPGLRNVELIERMYKKLKTCLQSVIQQNRPDKPEFLSELLNTMPDLRTLSTLHTEKLVVFRTEHKTMMRQQQLWSMNGSSSSTASSSILDDMETSSSKSPSPLIQNWTNSAEAASHQNTHRSTSDQCFDELAKSPMGSVSSTESNDTGIGTMEYSHYPSRYNNHSSIIIGVSSGNGNNGGYQQSASSITSSAPLLAATLSGTNCCPMRASSTRVSNSSAEDEASAQTSSSSNNLPAPPAAAVHLVQNGLTITPVLRQVPVPQPPPPNNMQQIRYRKLDSPTDSGIESGNEKQNEKAGTTIVHHSSGSSSCSSPRSSVDEVSIDHYQRPSVPGASQQQQQTIDDMPVLKRVLQAPPLYDTNSLMDEAYKPHKKFRAMRIHSSNSASSSSSSSSFSECTSAVTSQQTGVVVSNGHEKNHHHPAQLSQLHMHLTRTQTNTTSNNISYNSSNNSNENNNSNSNSTSTAATANNQQPSTLLSSLSSTHSVLAKSLMEEPRMTPEQMKRSDIIQNYIMRDKNHSSPYNKMQKWSPQPQQSPASVICPVKREQQNLNSPAGPSSRVLELKVDITENDGPLNLSKKTETSPPSSSVSPPANETSNTSTSQEKPSQVIQKATTPTVHKILLEA